MPQLLEGSCHCGAIRFIAQSSTFVPYQLCLCSICRKTCGAGGSINLAADIDTFLVRQGKEHIRVYEAGVDCDSDDFDDEDDESVPLSRSFCTKCSAMLWIYDDNRPGFIYPFASAIDYPELENPKVLVVVHASSKSAYVRLPEGEKIVYDEDANFSAEEWHKKHGKFVE
ncbi:Mss4-like protein [Hygrophoropsis aurantiaca]|uniref:Mss4-like protein n=1 Tax=Hygrophoropsis aurantiaca TaxID=72124 RepID=A0ACB8A8F9_9AGAM|nr:Mss4-like protein [Hygrophoropsis aurantiaca]